MSDRRLQVFHAVARMLSFTKAAEVLHMTQPAVTFQIRQLEEQFDTRLFDRAHNKVSLTDAGHLVFEYAERIFEHYSEMENAIREMTGNFNGSLTIGASTTIAEYMLPALLGDYNEENPDIRLRLRVSNTEGIVSMIENNVIDLEKDLVFDSMWKKFSPLKLIKNNISQTRDEARDRMYEMRNIMFIAESPVLWKILFDCGILGVDDTEVIFGSKFLNDIDSNIYLYKTLEKIRLTMSTGKVCVLLKLDELYDSMYDVLNQKYL